MRISDLWCPLKYVASVVRILARFDAMKRIVGLGKDKRRIWHVRIGFRQLELVMRIVFRCPTREPRLLRSIDTGPEFGEPRVFREIEDCSDELEWIVRVWCKRKIPVVS